MEQEKQKQLREELIDKYNYLLKKSDICEILSISTATLSRMMANSEIEYIKSSKSSNSSVRFTVDSVTNYIFNNTIKCFKQGGI